MSSFAIDPALKARSLTEFANASAYTVLYPGENNPHRPQTLVRTYQATVQSFPEGQAIYKAWLRANGRVGSVIFGRQSIGEAVADAFEAASHLYNQAGRGREALQLRAKAARIRTRGLEVLRK